MISFLRSASKEAWVSATMDTACSSELSAIAHKLRPLGVPYKDWPGCTSHGAALTAERDDCVVPPLESRLRAQCATPARAGPPPRCRRSGRSRIADPPPRDPPVARLHPPSVTKTPQRRAFLPFATLSYPRTWRLKSLA